MDIFSLARLAKSKGASDLHLIVASPPLFRIKGSIEPVTDMALTSEDITRFFNQITSDKERENFHQHQELDFGYTVPEVGRLRCNAAKQRGTISLVIRLLPPIIPHLSELGVPEVCKDLVLKPRGLVVVSGPTELKAKLVQPSPRV